MIKNISNITELYCCGCEACLQKCPKDCITMVQNERGFFIPKINSHLCIQCGLCSKTCPELESPKLYPVLVSYVATVNNLTELKLSTSGGVFGALSEYILSKKGIVYGCAWDNKLSVHHVRIDKLENLNTIRQSKYIQSRIENSFINTKKDLECGLPVLYSGTACQIAGLRKFLGTEYKNLITVEVACHGVPSPGLFEKYIIWQELKQNHKIVEFQFRNKEKHKKGEHFMFWMKFQNGRKKYGFSSNDPYYGSFLEGRTLRETCYHCKYKKQERVADFLLGDYWGVEKEHPLFPSQYGASAVVITTQKANNIFNEIHNQLITEDTTFNKITKHNHSIISVTKCIEQDKLKTINCDVEILFERLKPAFNLSKTIKNLIPENLKTIIKRMK